MSDWIIRVYANESDHDPCDSWIIENRLESEAEREASWTILANYPDAADWTIMAAEKSSS